jgi:hypothetical protein
MKKRVGIYLFAFAFFMILSFFIGRFSTLLCSNFNEEILNPNIIFPSVVIGLSVFLFGTLLTN